MKKHVLKILVYTNVLSVLCCCLNATRSADVIQKIQRQSLPKLTCEAAAANTFIAVEKVKTCGIVQAGRR